MTPMKERPILFSGPMVSALLAGTKTQTRRVMKRQKQYDFTDYTLFGQRGHPDDEAARRGGWVESWVAIEHAPDWPDGKEDQCRCPYASRRGDQLWVREAWNTHACFDAIPPRDLTTRSIHYAADGAIDTGKYRPPMFMPRWASRIQLEVTGLRVERLQEISEADARAEGVTPNDAYAGPERDRLKGWRTAFHSLWDSINGEKGRPWYRVNPDRMQKERIAPPHSWSANPWVWVLEFRRIET
jgi:hypothetical protein